MAKLDISEKVIALSLLLIVTGPLLMYYSIVNDSTSSLLAGLFLTASGMLLAFLSPQHRHG
jgi:uncharacterized membrane protein (UPF0136 family)